MRALLQLPFQFLIIATFFSTKFLVRAVGKTCAQTGSGPTDLIMSGSMNPSYMWYKDGHRVMVPVVLDPTYTHSEASIILGGLKEIESQTCVSFDIFHDEHRLHGDDYVYITRSKSRGCWSYVGRVGNGKQDLSLPPGCINHRTAIHEMMHALGFPHEHTRTDRDNFVQILYHNIQRGRESNFERKRHSKTDMFGPYDYGSIMHYEKNAFSHNGRDTIRPLKPGVAVGVDKHMSYWDARKINNMYKCGSVGYGGHRGGHGHGGHGHGHGHGGGHSPFWHPDNQHANNIEDNPEPHPLSGPAIGHGPSGPSGPSLEDSREQFPGIFNNFFDDANFFSFNPAKK